MMICLYPDSLPSARFHPSLPWIVLSLPIPERWRQVPSQAWRGSRTAQQTILTFPYCDFTQYWRWFPADTPWNLFYFNGLQAHPFRKQVTYCPYEGLYPSYKMACGLVSALYGTWGACNGITSRLFLCDFMGYHLKTRMKSRRNCKTEKSELPNELKESENSLIHVTFSLFTVYSLTPKNLCLASSLVLNSQTTITPKKSIGLVPLFAQAVCIHKPLYETPLGNGGIMPSTFQKMTCKIQVWWVSCQLFSTWIR
jgi:hypothetical protein